MKRRSKWEIEVGDAALDVSKNGTRITLPYDQIVRVEKLWPSPRECIFHLTEKPEVDRPQGAKDARAFIPIGHGWQHVRHRLLKLSVDLLVQCENGTTAVFPLRALDKNRRRDLWETLCTNAPKAVFRRNSLEIRQAVDFAKQADTLNTGGKVREAQKAQQQERTLWKLAGLVDCLESSIRAESENLVSVGRFDEADRLAVRALEIARNINNPELGIDYRRQVAENLNILANIAWHTGDVNGLTFALDCLPEAATLFKQVGLPFYHCRMISNQALIHEELYRLVGGDHIGKCRALAEQANEMLHASCSATRIVMHRMQEANNLGTLARCSLYKGEELLEDGQCELAQVEFENAARQFEQASSLAESVENYIPEDLAMRARALFRLSQGSRGAATDPEHLRLLERSLLELTKAVRGAQSGGDLSVLLEVYKLRGDTYRDLDNLPAAVYDYEIVTKLLENEQAAYPRPADRAAALRRYERVYRQTVEMLLELAKEPNAESHEHAKTTFKHSESVKSRNLAERLNIANHLLAQLPVDLRGEFWKAVNRRYSAEIALGRISREQLAPAAHLFQESRVEMQSAIQDYEQVCDRIEVQKPGFKAQLSPAVPTVAELRRWLPRDGSGAVLEFCVGEKSLSVFLITSSGSAANTCFNLPRLGRKALEDIVLQHAYFRAYDAWQRGLLGSDAWRDLIPNLISTIDQNIISASGSTGRSIRMVLDEHAIRRLVIIPDGILHRLPFHAAMENIVVTYNPSAAVLIQTIARHSGTPEGRALVVANPDFCRDNALLQLPEAEIAADILESILWRSGMIVTPLRNKSATKDNILESMRDAALSVYYTHAKSHLADPLHSRMYVAGERESINAEEIMSRGVVRPGSWQVMVACEAALSTHEPGGEYLGFPAAWLVAGASVVVAPMWSAHAGMSAILMERFFHHVFEDGLAAADALHKASSDVRSMPRHRVGQFEALHGLEKKTLLKQQDYSLYPDPPSPPFYWAPFMVCGAAWTRDEVDKTTGNSLAETHASALPFSVGINVPVQAREKYREFAKLMERERYAEVIPLVNAYIEERGGSLEIHDILAAAHHSLHDFDEALIHSKKALAYDQNSFQLHYNMGCLYRDFAHIEEARECFSRALSLNPAYTKSMCNLAELCSTPEAALEWLHNACELDPADEDIPKAVEMWEHFLGKDPNILAKHRLMWADKAFAEKEVGIARFHLAMARELPLTSVEIGLGLRIESDILRNEQDIARSVAALRQATQADPTVAAYWNTLGARLLLLIHQNPRRPMSEHLALLQEAENACRTAARLGDYSKPHQNLAITLSALGRFEEARSEGNIALALATRQIQASKTGKLICIGCPTQGQIPAECAACLQKSQGTLRDIDLATGDYGISPGDG